MTAKEYLRKLSMLRTKMENKKRELREINKEIGICSRPESGAGRVQTSFVGATGNQTEQQAIRIAALKEEISEYLVTYLEEKNKIIDQIHELNDAIYIDILYKRYVREERHFEKIAFDMGYSYQYIINKHGAALKAFEDKFPDLFEKRCYKK